jgi:tetratricopeptide (TPR) repeat protein
MQTCLERALNFFIKATDLWPKFVESTYCQAKCYCLTGQLEEGRKKLEHLASLDPRYLTKAAQDKDFRQLWPEIEGRIGQFTFLSVPRAVETLALIQKTVETIEWGKGVGLKSFQEFHPKTLENIERVIKETRDSLQGMNFDVEKLYADALAARRQAEAMVENGLKIRIQGDSTEKARAELGQFYKWRYSGGSS